MSKQIYEELLAAGAPELPEGWFYQIDDDSVYWVGLKIRVRRHRKCWFSKTLGEAEVHRTTVHEWGTDLLVDGCATAYEKAVKATAPRQDHLGELRRFIGRHP